MDGGLGDRGTGLVSIDFTAIGIEFKAEGWTATKVALVLNLPRTTVEDWFKLGRHPRYVDGLCLMRLHARVVDKRIAA